MPNHPSTFSIDSFTGLQNTLRDYRSKSSNLKVADNVLLDRSGGLQMRPGHTEVTTGNFHSIWSNNNVCYVVEDGTLKQLTTGNSLTTVQAGFGSKKVAYLEINGEVYVTNSTKTGKITGSTFSEWGMPIPPNNFTIGESAGQLSQGRYQLSTTYIDLQGNESGAEQAVTFTTTANSKGFILTNIPDPTSLDSNISFVRIYVSTTDGEILYYNQQITAGTTSALIANVRSDVSPLKAIGIDKPPAGEHLAIHNGRALVANGAELYYSDTQSYNHFRFDSNYKVFPDTIRGLMVVPGGVWVASDALYYISGQDIHTGNMSRKENLLMTPGTEVYVPGAYIFLENTPAGPKWLIQSNEGIYVLMDQGLAFSMTSLNVAMPTGEDGAAVFLQQDGINSYLSLVRNPDSSGNNAAIGDNVRVEIRNNNRSGREKLVCTDTVTATV